MRKILSGLFAALVVTTVSVFVSCEVGLGPAVDIQPPNITIVTPQVDKVIRNKFAISGTWQDDGVIDNVYVVLKRTDNLVLDGNTNKQLEFPATFEVSEVTKESGTWQAIIDPFDSEMPILDGTYQATAYIKDKGNHKTSQSTTFTIDNTAPVIVLTRPSTSAEAASSDTYGQTFNLEGQAADNNNVSLIEVQVYKDKECTEAEYEYTIRLKNVPNSINMDAAVYDKEKGGYISQDDAKYNFEVPLESNSSGKDFYCKIIAYDGAEEFPVDAEQTEENKKGNAVDYYYLYKDIATEVLQNYKITEVYSIYNKTFTDRSTSRSVTSDDVLTLLESKKTFTGRFTLNPRNNPTFAITGRSPLLLDGNDFAKGKNDLSNGGQIVIEVSPGLDGIPLVESSLKVYAQQCDANGKVLPDAQKIYPPTTMSESGTSYRFATTILRAQGFEIGSNYIFGVEGYDSSKSKNAVEPAGKAYGIHVASSGNAPKLEVTTPASGEDVYLNQGKSQIFEGKITVETGVPVLNIFKGNNPEPIITKVYSLEEGKSEGSGLVYSFKETVDDFGTSSGKVVFKFTANQDGVDSPVVEREIIYDILAPEVVVLEPARANKYDEAGNLDSSAKFVNGTIVFDATVKDKGGSNLASAKYEILTGGNVVKTEELDLENDISVSVDTTASEINDKEFIFRITALDNAGNSFSTDDSKYTYKAEQNTDIPYLVKHSLTDDERADGKKELDFAMTSIEFYNSLTKENKLGTVTKGDYMKFNCYDDDGTVSITIKNKKIASDSEWEADVNALTQVYSKSKDTKTLTAFDDYQFPNTDDECGFYEYAIILSDGNKTKTTGPFLVNVAKDRASIRVEARPDWAKDGNKFYTTITITPSMGKYYAYKKIGEGDWPANAATFAETDALVINDEIPVSDLPDDETKVTYKIVDGNNQTSNEVYIILKKDNEAPSTLTITAPVEGKINKQAISDDEYAFRGEVKDDKSGVEYIYYYFGSEETPPTDETKYTQLPATNGNYIINKEIADGTSPVTDKLHEGKWYLYIKAKDVAGNTSGVLSREFDIDKSAPELTEAGEDDLGYKKGAFTLSGTVTETNGLATSNGLVITDDKGHAQWTVTPSGSNWSQDISGLTEGKHTLTITATDKATKTSTLKRLVTIDSVKPVVSDTMSLPNGYSFAASSISLSGTVTDAAPSSGLSKVEYYFTDGTTASAKKSTTFTAEGQAYWSASIPTNILSGSNASDMNGVFDVQGTKYITVTAYDNAGNASVSVTKPFVYDTSNPGITDVTIKYTGDSDSSPLGTDTVYKNKNGYTISGKFSDDGSNVTIGVTCNGGSVGNVTQTNDSKSGTWTFTTSGLADNNYSYIITATDASGRTATVNAYIVVDRLAPVVTITETADVYKNTGALTFNGTITEAYIDTVTASLFKKNATTAEKTETIYPVNGSWNWTVTGLEDAEYTLKVEATDKAENSGSATSGKNLIVDSKEPDFTVTSSNLADSNGSSVAAGTKLIENNTYYTSQNFTLSATVDASEANLDKVTIAMDGGSASPLSLSGGKYTYTPTNITGTHAFTITAIDKAKNQKSFTVTVSKDTTAPAKPSITAPASGKTGTNAISDNTFIFKGSASDEENGSGIAKILYQFTADSVTSAPESGYSEISSGGGNWTITKTIEDGTTAADGNLHEGKYYLYVKAQDKAGNISVAQSVRFDIDKASPVITTKLNGIELALSTEQKCAADYTFKFAISESNSFTVNDIIVKKGINSLARGTGYKIKNSSGTEITNFSTITSGSEYSIEIPSQTDELYTYTISVTDAVGKTASATRLIRLDQSAPVISITSPDFAHWQNSSAFSVIGTAVDASGTSAVYYSLNSQKTIPTTDILNPTSWTSKGWTKANGSDSWNISLTNVPDSGENKFYLAAVDTIGNVTTTAQAVTMMVDSSAPVLENFYYKLGENGDIKQAQNTVYISTTGNPTLTVYGSYSDTGSGVAALTTSPAATISYSTTVITNAASISGITAWTTLSSSNEKTIKSWKAEYTPSTGGSFAITGKNKAGLENKQNAFTLVVDNSEPNVNAAFYIKEGDKLTQAFLKNGTYYINPTGKQFTVTGNTTDNYLLDKVVLEFMSSNGKTQTETKNNFNSAVTEFEFTSFSLENWTGVNSAKITVYDMAGNSKEVPFVINFDTTGPAGYHEADDKNKDLYFRIGNSNNDDIDSNNNLWDDDLDLDVGGKYSEGTYGKDSQIRVRGNITDAGSGVKTIYYAIFDKEIIFHGSSTEPQPYTDTEDGNKAKLAIKDAASLRDYVKAHATGSFAPGSTVTKRVFYNVAPTDGHTLNGTKLSDTLNKNNCYTYYKEVETNYDHDFSGFVNPENYFVIVAEDNLGNIGIDYAVVGSESKYYAALNYDHIPPSINKDENSSGIQFVNVEEKNGNIVFKNGNNVTVAGTVTDADSKPKSITIEANGHTITTTQNDYGKITAQTTTTTEANDTITWSAVIYAKTFEGATGNIVITANATDGAYNTASMPVATVVMDTKAPEPVLTVSFDADDSTAGNQVNKKITLNGTASDDNTLPTAAVSKIQYSLKGNGWTEANATWTDYTDTSDEFAISGNYSFTVSNFDTAKLTDDKTYALRAVAADVAGNIGYSAPVEIKVAQDSDRPIVTLTNLSLVSTGTSFLKSTTTLEGTVSDDDGAITGIQYSKDGTNWTPLTLNGSSWKINGLTEGANTVYFKVTDSKGTTFTTAAAGATGTEEIAGQPKIKDSKTTPTYVTNNNGSLALSFKVVTQKPDVTITNYQIYAEDGTTKLADRATLGTLGGIYKKFKITLKAKSASFISGAKVTYAGTDYEFTCADQHFDDEDEHTWTSDLITLGDEKTLALAVSDASSTEDPMVYEQSISFAIDNKEPTITIEDPSQVVGVKETMQFAVSEGATVYFAVTKKDVTTAPAANSTKWTQLTDDSNGLTWYVAFDDDLSLADHTDRFALYLTEPTAEKPNRLNITTVSAINDNDNPFTEIQTVHFWVMAVDSCGNEGTAYKEVKVDPQGNRPSVTLTYPVNDSNGNPPTKGGTIRLDGTAADDLGAKYVWIQIDTGKDGFDAGDLKFLSTNNYEIGTMSNNAVVPKATVAALSDDADVSGYGIRVPVSGSSWNLSINSNQEFNQKAGTDGKARLDIKFFATDEDPDKQNPGVTNIHKSIDENNTQTILIDSNSPYIDSESLILVSYDNNGNEIARKQYKDGDNIHGIWYLQGIIKDDDSGIKKIEYQYSGETKPTTRISSAGGTWTDSADSNFYFIPQSHLYDGETIYDYKFSVPLGNSNPDEVGEHSIRITATEKTDQNLNTNPEYKITYDNKAPEFITQNNVNVKLNPVVQNENGFYTFGAVASEDKVGDVNQSGLERIAFYFTRDLNYSLKTIDATLYGSHVNEKGGKTNDLFDIMIKHINNDSADTSSGNMIINYKGKSEGDSPTLVYEEGLYWKKLSGKTKDKTFTYTSTLDPNIHAKGLIKINGVIYLIDSVNGKVVNLVDDFGSTEKTVDAYFAVCNVIDKGGEKNGSAMAYPDNGYGYGYYPSRTTDDGDLITETFNAQGSEWIFDASINSKNLPDGPITLHIVAFDKAGNYTETPYTMDGTVSNNAPRLAGMILGTDENGDGEVSGTEFNTVSYTNMFNAGKNSRGEEMHQIMLPVQDATKDNPQSALTVKGKTVIKPEVVGGNGNISYKYSVYNYNAKTDGQFTWNTTAEKADVAGRVIAVGTTDDTAATLSAFIELPVTAFIGTDGTAQEPKDSKLIEDGKYKKFDFTFSDQTPGVDGAAQSGNATMSVIMDVALREINAAKNWILPFYWKSKTENSLFKQSKDNGHIELASDWVTTNSYSGDSGEYDADPKVSGMIKLEGIAQDDTLLDEILVKFGKKLGGAGGFTADEDTAIASYNTNDGSWTTTPFAKDANNNDIINTTTGWASVVQQATYQDLLDAKVINELPANTDATAKVPYNSQTYGHIVHWILYLDTAKFDGVAATDVTVTATATDRGKPEWNGSAVVYTPNDAIVTTTASNSGYSAAVTKTGTAPNVTVTTADLTGKYRVDVVPYIKSISTPNRTVSGLKDNNIRSASGKYSILANRSVTSNGVTTSNDIVVSGFNLSTSSLVVRLVSDSVMAATGNNVLKYNTAEGTGIKNLSLSANGRSTSSVTIKNGSGTNGSTVSSSGYLEMFSNQVRSLNNLNTDNARGSVTGTTISDYENYYNREADYYTTKNVQLTDDRYLRFFDMKDTGNQTRNGYYPTLIMEGDEPVFGYLNPSGGRNSDVGIEPNTGAGASHPAYAMAQRAKFNTDGEELYIEYLAKNSVGSQMGIARDDDGRFHHVSVFDRDNCAMWYVYDRYAELYNYGNGFAPGVGISTNYGNWNYMQNEGNNGLALDTVNYGTLLTGRYMYPKMVAKGNSKTSTASVYIAYYDDNTHEILIRDFLVGTRIADYSSLTQSYSNITFTYNNRVGNSNNRKGFEAASTTTNYGSNYLKVNDQYYKMTQQTYTTGMWGGTTNYYYTIEGFDSGTVTGDVYSGTPIYSFEGNESGEAKALDSTHKDASGTTYSQYVNFTENNNTDTTSAYPGNNQYNTGRLQAVSKGSKYFDMKVTSDNHIIIVYYDDDSSALKLKYSTNAVTGSNPTQSINWETPEIDFPEYVGNYVSLALDVNDGIHITGFDANDSDLYYMYLPSYSSTSITKERVDQYGSVGHWTQVKIDTIHTSSPYYNKPVIAYYNSTETGGRDAIKLAIANATVGNTTSGVDASGYTTGAWEFMTVPAITPPQGGDPKFQNVCLDFDSSGTPVVGYLGTNLEFGKWFGE